MRTALLQQASFIGRLRYYFMERYYSQTIRYLWIGIAIVMTLMTTVLLRNPANPKVILIGFIPVIVLAGLAGFVLLYFNMSSLPIVVLVMTLFLNDGLSTGTDTKLTFTFLVLNVWALIWVFKMTVIDRHIDVRPTPSNVLALLFMLAVVISYVWSYIFVDRTVKFVFDDKFLARTMTAVVLIISPGAFLLYANHFRSMKTIRAFVWIFLFAGFVMLALHFLHPEGIPLLNSKAQFPAWVGGLALGQALFNLKMSKYVRLLLLGLVGGWCYVQLVQGISWLSGWVPLCISCGIVLFFYSRRWFLIVLIAGGIFYFGHKAFVQGTIDEENAVSGETRVNAWQQVMDLTVKHYLFGTGPAGYQYYFSTYEGYMYQLSHNNYVDIVAQTGIFGFSIFIGFWLSTTYMAVKMVRSLRKEDGFAYGLGITLLSFNVAIYAIMMLGDWVTPFTYTQGLAGIDYDIWSWMMTGLTVALYYVYKAEKRSQQDSLAIVRSQ